MYSIAYAAALWLQTYLTLCNPMAVALQAHLSMGFSKQEYQSGLPSQARVSTWVSCIADRVFTLSHQGSPVYSIEYKLLFIFIVFADFGM